MQSTVNTTHAHFGQIKEAIAYISEHFTHQPSLEEVAARVHLSPYHFQRLFTDWAGVSPKKFLQYITLQHAKQMLNTGHRSLSDTAYTNGLSGISRLHDLFIKLEGMTPGEYKKGGEGIVIRYQYADSIFGRLLIASTQKGICYMAFADEESVAMNELKRLFPHASYKNEPDPYQIQALDVISGKGKDIGEIKLHLKATPFQLKVWELLLRIPQGQACSYGQLAQAIGQPGAARAVGTAVGDNPVAFLIPCHRVIRSSGVLGDYHWGSDRKMALLGWESARADQSVTDAGTSVHD
ncbi:MAG: methylated-DNA--[protein]-cysteine S-methyltransferase [Chitinophagaceae bacterium]